MSVSGVAGGSGWIGSGGTSGWMARVRGDALYGGDIESSVAGGGGGDMGKGRVLAGVLYCGKVCVAGGGRVGVALLWGLGCRSYSN